MALFDPLRADLEAKALTPEQRRAVDAVTVTVFAALLEAADAMRKAGISGRRGLLLLRKIVNSDAVERVWSQLEFTDAGEVSGACLDRLARVFDLEESPSNDRTDDTTR